MSQVDRLLKLLGDKKPHRTDEIVAKVCGPGLSLARVGARVYDLKKRLPAGQTIRGYRDLRQPTLYWYVLEAPLFVYDEANGLVPPVPLGQAAELFPKRFGVTL